MSLPFLNTLDPRSTISVTVSEIAVGRPQAWADQQVSVSEEVAQ